MENLFYSSSLSTLVPIIAYGKLESTPVELATIIASDVSEIRTAVGIRRKASARLTCPGKMATTYEFKMEFIEMNKICLSRLLQGVGGNGAICNCRRCVQQKRIVANWGQSLHLQCSVTLPGDTSSPHGSHPYKWVHIPSYNQIGDQDAEPVKFR
jgi:hypothetical protein